MGIEINKINTINNAGKAGVKVSEVSSSVKASIMSTNANDIELIKKLGITKDELYSIRTMYSDIDISSLPFDKQLELVSDYRKQATAQMAIYQKNTDVSENIDTTAKSTEKFSKTEFNNMTFEQKVDACFAEFAKNQYIYGTKHEGKVISEPHSEEEWDALSPEEQKNIIEKIKSAINNDEKLSGLKELVLGTTNSKDQAAIADGVMRGIQAASMDGISYLEFLHKDEYDRVDLVESYLNVIDSKELNENDKKYLDHLQLLSSAVKEIAANNENGNINTIECNQDVREYIKRNNLNEDELVYKALQAKINKGAILSENEQKQFDELKKFMETDAGKLQTQKAKAANLIKLQAQYDELQAKVNNGEKLDSREQGLLNNLKNTLNSKESNSLKELIAVMPKPQTDKEKQIASDLETFQNEIKDHVKGAGSEAGAIFAFIENKCKDMTPEEQKDYRITALKFYNGSASSNLFKAYAEKYDLWNDEYLLDKAALNAGEASTEEFSTHMKTIEAVKNSDNDYIKINAEAAEMTAGQVLKRDEYKIEKHDDKKLIYSSHAAKTKNAKVQKQATDVNITIVNAGKQGKAQNELLASENATNEVKVYSVEQSYRFHKENQYSVVNNATEGCKEATAVLAEGNVIEKLNKDVQTDVFKLGRSRIEEQFNEQEAIKYSNALADQIQNCNKDNQLEMHNDIMQSKYSEVQERAASNINKLDPTVQNDAVDSVIRSGNEKAVSSAMNSLQKCSPEVQKVQTINMAVQNAVENANAEEKAKLLNSTHLTPEQFEKLTPSEKKEYYKRIFDKASPGEKIEMLSKLPGSQQKTVYTLICRFFPEVLSSMLKDSTTAEKMLNSGMPVDAVNKVITILQSSEDLEIIKLLDKMSKNPLYKSYFADKKDDEIKEPEVKDAKLDAEYKDNGIDFIANTFATSPKDLALKNKKIKGNMDLRV